MEKLKRHYSLSQIKSLVQNGDWRVTFTAHNNAYHDFDYALSDIKNAVLRLKHKDFYKSMTSLHDATIWQDVYRPLINNQMAYIKLTVVENNTVVIQFKKK